MPASRARSARRAVAISAGRIAIADDVETAQRRRESEGGEMRSRERRRHRQGRHDTTERAHGFDALAGRNRVADAPGCTSQANAVSEKMAHGPARGCEVRLAATGRVDPGALHAGEIAREIGDRCDHRRPDLGSHLLVAPIVAAWMKSQARGPGQDGNAAIAEIAFGKLPWIGCDIANKRRAASVASVESGQRSIMERANTVQPRAMTVLVFPGQ